jgi:hypothetical protein
LQDELQEFNLMLLTALTRLDVHVVTKNFSSLGPLPTSLVQLKISSRVSWRATSSRRLWDAGWGALPALESLQLEFYLPDEYDDDEGEDGIAAAATATAAAAAEEGTRKTFFFKIAPDFELASYVSLKTISIDFLYTM